MSNERIIQKYKRVHVENLDFKPLGETTAADCERGFVFKIEPTEIPNESEETLLSVGGFLTVVVRSVDVTATTEREESDGYAAYRSGSRCAAIEARLAFKSFHSNWKEIRLGLPLSLFPPTEPFYLQYDGVRLRWIYRGEQANYDYPFGALDRTNDSVFVGKNCKAAAFFGKSVPETNEEEILERGIRFYSPRGFNAWVGDVVNYFRDGRYYLVYLADSHHHGNRFGTGAHTAALVTTDDFVTWTDHGWIFDLEAQWQTFGTGTLFHDGEKFVYVHGFHTSRTLPPEKLAGRKIAENYEKLGCTTPLGHDEILASGLYPNGANYFVSDDGVRFTSARTQFHWCENPSVYAGDDGLTLYAGYGGGGTWKAASTRGPWRRTDKNFPPKYDKTILRCSDECPSIFSKNGFKYMIVGFVGYFRTNKNSDEFIEVGAVGEDVYDGLGVPMVAKTDDDRLILGGWLARDGKWASLLLHRELVQRENGRLDMRWLPESTPDETALEEVKPKNGWQDLDDRSYYFTATVDPAADSVVTVTFAGEGEGCSLTLDSREKIIEIRGENNPYDGEGYLPPAYIAVPEYIEKHCSPDDEYANAFAAPNVHRRSKDFSLALCDVLEKRYSLKIIVHYEPKTADVFLDVEIGGKRTLASSRPRFKLRALSVAAVSATVSSPSLYKL